jgi:tyrosyl-tRNA synthetase
VGLDGAEKMSKSLGNHIALEDPPREYFGKTMSIPDALMWEWYLLLTDLSEDEITERRRDVESGALHPKKAKEELASLLTADYHGSAAAHTAAKEFETVFAEGGLPDEIPLITLAGTITLPSALSNANLVASKNEARRLIQQGAVTLDGEKTQDPFLELEPRNEPYLVKVGKRRFVRLRLE